MAEWTCAHGATLCGAGCCSKTGCNGTVYITTPLMQHDFDITVFAGSPPSKCNVGREPAVCHGEALLVGCTEGGRYLGDG